MGNTKSLPFKNHNKTSLPLRTKYDSIVVVCKQSVCLIYHLNQVTFKTERKLLRRAVNRLGEREKTIIQLRFGLNDPNGTEMTQKEVATYLGISQSYISRLEKKIMKRLKREMAS